MFEGGALETTIWRAALRTSLKWASFTTSACCRYVETLAHISSCSTVLGSCHDAARLETLGTQKTSAISASAFIWTRCHAVLMSQLARVPTVGKLLDFDTTFQHMKYHRIPKPPRSRRPLQGATVPLGFNFDPGLINL